MRISLTHVGGTLMMLTTLSASAQQYHAIDVTPIYPGNAARLTAATRGKQVGGGSVHGSGVLSNRR